MTKKDYKMIAEVISSAKEKQKANQLDEPIRYIMINLADKLKMDNALFDYNKFYKACGI